MTAIHNGPIFFAGVATTIPTIVIANGSIVTRIIVANAIPHKTRVHPIPSTFGKFGTIDVAFIGIVVVVVIVVVVIAIVSIPHHTFGEGVTKCINVGRHFPQRCTMFLFL